MATSTRFTEPCGHKNWNKGCPSCELHDRTTEFQLVSEEKLRREQLVNGCRKDLEQEDLTATERARLEKQLKDAEASLSKCVFFRNQLKVLVARWREQVEKQLAEISAAGLGSADYPERFSAAAKDCGEFLEHIWRNARMTNGEDDDGFLITYSEHPDPECERSFQGLDRSNIPATPDVLVEDGIGLRSLVYAGTDFQNMKQLKLPTDAVGLETGVAAKMGYGRALDKFGKLPEPGVDWDRAPQTSDAKVVEEGVASLGLGGHASRVQKEIEIAMKGEQLHSGPKTEQELRERDFGQPTVANLASDEQWALFQHTKLFPGLANLARHYVILCEHHRDGREDYLTNWPQVEDLSWAGFTNWIDRCKKECKMVNKDFFMNVVRPWNAYRAKRAQDIAAKLQVWKAPTGFDDGTSDHPDVNSFYKCDYLCRSVDAKSLGAKAKKR